MATQTKKKPNKPQTGKERQPDHIDFEIMRHLRKDPQSSNKALADALDLSEMTIANRINSLVDRRLMKVTIQRDIRTLGYTILAVVDVYVTGREAEKVGRALAAIPEVFASNIVMGEPELVLIVMAKSVSHLGNILEFNIATIPGVARTVTSIALDMIKFTPGIAAL
jgi:DNA-binding Lrp family transcriptional regulator